MRDQPTIPRPNQSLYNSLAWKRLRLATRRRDRFRCVVCGANVAAPGTARSDHIISVQQRPDLALVASNVRTLCVEHDNQAHREKGHGRAQRDARFVIRGADGSGMPLDPNHPWHNGR